MSQFGKSYLLGAVWLAAVLRFPALFANTFHADEALFAHWARLIATWRNPLLLAQPVDKPPLLFYLQALFYPLLGPVEWAARLPDFIASLLMVPLLGLLAWRIYGEEWMAILAALVVALSPLSIQFSATAFTDPLMTLLVVAALAAAIVNCQLSGFLFGLALATKHQSWLFLPLFIGVGLLSGWRRHRWSRWLAGLVAVLLLLLLWEWARSGSLALWSAQITNFGGIRPVWSWELWPRLVAWLALWQYVAARPLLLAGTVGAAVLLLKGCRIPGRAAAFDLLFIIFLAAYGLLHWLMAIPVWDRYLLPAVPIVALVVSRGLWQIVASLHPIGRGKFRANLGNLSIFTTLSPVYRRSFLPMWISALALLVLVTVQLPVAWQARGGRFPVGGQQAADQGVTQVAQLLAAAPYGTVLYDHWYSWQWRYHLFDQRVYVSWFPHPAALAEDLTIFGHDGSLRYLALPDTPGALPVRRAVTESGFQLEPVFIEAQTDITLYQVLPVTR